MDLAEAMQLVLELARQSIISNPEVRARQEAACELVEDFAVNHLGDN